MERHYFIASDSVTTAAIPRTGRSDPSAGERRQQILDYPDTKPVGGTVYYISPSGDDANAGDSPAQAWRTLGGYEAHLPQVQAGDSLLFERGGIYRGHVSLRTGVFYGAYGQGEKPRIYGSPRNYDAPEDWQPTNRPGVWRCADTFPQDVGSIFFDGGRQVGIKKLHTLDAVQNDYDFYHDPADGSLYLCLAQSPAALHREIELGVAMCILSVGGAVHDIVMENLCIQYGGAHAIAFSDGAHAITVRGCVVAWIGGCLQNPGVNDVRFGNGIQFWNACADICIEDCWVYQIYDAGLTHQGGAGRVENVTYRRNLVEYCVYAFELFLGGDEGMHRIRYEDNILRFSGYGWGKQRPDPQAESLLCAWGAPFTAEDFVVQRNTFDQSRHWLVVNYQEAPTPIVYRDNIWYQTADPAGKEMLDSLYGENPWYKTSDGVYRGGKERQDAASGENPCYDKANAAYRGGVARWQGEAVLTADSQETFEEQVRKLDAAPRAIQFGTEF